MSFKELKILPTTVYEFDIPDDCWEKIIKTISEHCPKNFVKRENQEHYGSHSRGISLHKDKNWKFLVEYIEKNLEEVKKNVGFENLEKLKVSLMWINKSETLEWHHKHVHPWSVISGIIYIQGLSGKTWFSRESEYACSFPALLPIAEDEKKHNIYKHEFKEKTMILFPSNLEHSVDENFEKLSRRTISFNSFPSGQVGLTDSLAGIYLDVL